MGTSKEITITRAILNQLLLFLIGSIKDVLYKLNTFGLPSSALPLADDGEPKTKTHKNWLKLRKSQEQSQMSGDLPLSIVVVPNRLDILLGRGKPIQEHFGNIRYHTILDHYQEAYERAKKFQKMKIAQQILDTVKEYGGNFLRQEGAGWLVVDETVGRDKIAHAFRTRRMAAPASPTATMPNSTPSLSSNISLVPSSAIKRTNLDLMTTIPEQVPSSAAGFHSKGAASSTANTTVTDEEQDSGSSSLSEDSRAQSGKRVKLWASAFHEVPS
jgi:hypothetical protein